MLWFDRLILWPVALLVMTQPFKLDYGVCGNPLTKAPEDAAGELKLVLMVHRHGERYSLYSDRPSNSTADEIPFGQLTPVGICQLYQQGQFLRERYLPYIENGKIPSSDRIWVVSSDSDRTINSAQALLAGLLPPRGTARQWSSPVGDQWSPMPIHTQAFNADGMIKISPSTCPIYGSLRSSIGDLPIAKALKRDLKDFIKFVKPYVRIFGDIDKDLFETSEAVHDIIHYTRRQSYLLNVTGPVWPASMDSWMNSTLADTFEHISDLRLHALAGGNGDRKRTYFRVGNLLRDAFQKMTASSLRTKDSQQLKMVIYSGHDENVAALRAALNLYNYTIAGPNHGIPDFAALIIMELYSNDTVRILEQREPSQSDKPAEPEVLMHPDCHVEFCPLQKLQALLSDVTVTSDDQWKMNCALPV